MSHYIDQTVALTDLDVLKAVLNKLGIPFRENVRAEGYRGITTGICDIVIPKLHLLKRGFHVYGDFGYKRRADGSMRMEIDSYDSRTLESFLGKINQSYSEEVITKIAKRDHYRIERVQLEDGSVQLLLKPTLLTRIRTRAKERKFNRNEAKAQRQQRVVRHR